ncbi:MAG: hypothetical protein ACE5K2_00270 [Candidatus Zixiibacteriota bacterium]
MGSNQRKKNEPEGERLQGFAGMAERHSIIEFRVIDLHLAMVAAGFSLRLNRNLKVAATQNCQFILRNSIIIEVYSGCKEISKRRNLCFE